MNEDNKTKIKYAEWRKRKKEDGWIDVHLFVPKSLVPPIYELRRDLVYQYKKNGGK